MGMLTSEMLTCEMLSGAEADELTSRIQHQVITPTKARAITNRFILENLRDGFCAGTPCYVLIASEPLWIVPIVFAQPPKPSGRVGEVVVHALEAKVVGFTPPGEVTRNARALLS